MIVGCPDTCSRRTHEIVLEQAARTVVRHKQGVTMPGAADEHAQHRRPHSQPMAAAYLEFDLERELEQLHREPGWSSGQNAKTLVKYEDFRVVLTALKAHARLPGHHT